MAECCGCCSRKLARALSFFGKCMNSCGIRNSLRAWLTGNTNSNPKPAKPPTVQQQATPGNTHTHTHRWHYFSPLGTPFLLLLFGQYYNLSSFYIIRTFLLSLNTDGGWSSGGTCDTTQETPSNSEITITITSRPCWLKDEQIKTKKGMFWLLHLAQNCLVSKLMRTLNSITLASNNTVRNLGVIQCGC